MIKPTFIPLFSIKGSTLNVHIISRVSYRYNLKCLAGIITVVQMNSNLIKKWRRDLIKRLFRTAAIYFKQSDSHQDT